MAPLYECEGCGKEVPLAELVRTPMTKRALAGSAPTVITATVLGSGSFYDDTAATTSLTIPNMSLAIGETLLVVDALANLESPSTVTWGSENADNTLTNGSGSFVEFNAIYPNASGINDVTISWSGTNPTAIAAVAIALRGTRASSYDASGTRSSLGNGTGTTASANITTKSPSSTPAIAIAAVCTIGPSTDTEGSWTDGFTGLVRIGTSGATASNNATLAVATKFPLVTVMNPSLVGITSRPWSLASHPFLA